MENEFIEYIIKYSSAPRSSKNYANGIKKLSKYINKNIFQILSIEEIKNIIKTLELDIDFIEQDKNKWNNMYINSIKQYLSFLEFKNNEKLPIHNITLNELQKALTKELLKTVVIMEPNISYKDLAKRVTDNGLSLHHRQVGRNIGEISKLCVQLGLPMLSAKVMNQDSHIAGEGFFDLYKTLHTEIKGDPKYLFKKELEKIRKCDEWYKLTEYLKIEVAGIKKPKILENEKSENIILSLESVLPGEVCDDNYYEGAVKSVIVNKYERNPVAKRKCIEHYGTKCRICGFKFSEVYGSQFENKIHVHHIKSIAEIGEEYEIDPIKDLIPVCPNCHMVLHSKGKNEVYSVDEVKKMIKNNL